MKRLFTKQCPFCNGIIEGKKRLDRKAYHYAPRCQSCAYKSLSPEVLFKKQEALKKVRIQLPIGAKHLQKSRNGFTYVRIKVAHPNVWAYEHRVLLGAKPGQHVHHKNKDTLDNRIENLVLLTPQEHKMTHVLNQWARSFTCCKTCGTTRKKHLSHGLCTTCYQRQYSMKK